MLSPGCISRKAWNFLKEFEMADRKFEMITIFFFFAAVCWAIYGELHAVELNLVNAIDRSISTPPDSLLPGKKTSVMPIYKPDPKIDYKILKVQIDPDIDYKILKIKDFNAFPPVNPAPKSPKDSPFNMQPKIQTPLNPSPHGFQSSPDFPKETPKKK
jgi:hypothetical protein